MRPGSVFSAARMQKTSLAGQSPAVEVFRGQYNLAPATGCGVQSPQTTPTCAPSPDTTGSSSHRTRPRVTDTQYGVTAESLALPSGSKRAILSDSAPGRAVTNCNRDDPAQVWTMGTAVAMLVLHVPHIHITAKIFRRPPTNPRHRGLHRSLEGARRSSSSQARRSRTQPWPPRSPAPTTDSRSPRGYSVTHSSPQTHRYELSGPDHVYLNSVRPHRPRSLPPVTSTSLSSLWNSSAKACSSDRRCLRGRDGEQNRKREGN